MPADVVGRNAAMSSSRRSTAGACARILNRRGDPERQYAGCAPGTPSASPPRVVPAEKASNARTRRSRPARSRRRLGCLLAAAWLGTAAPVAAQPRTPRADGRGSAPIAAGDQRRILLLRAEETPPKGAAAEVERSLRQALRELGFVVTVSSMPFRDAQLASGCPGTIRECGPSMAGAVEGGRLAVSTIKVEEGEGALSLRLFSFAASGEAREAASELPSSPAAQHGAVQQLVQSVYGQPAHDTPPSAARSTQARHGGSREAASPAATARAHASSAERVEPQPARYRDPVLWATGWSATGLGGALLIGGMASHLAAGSSESRYPWGGDGGRPPGETLASYERAERRADAARVLYGAGGALLLTGATLLVVGRLAAPRDSSLQAALLPLSHGAALSFAGSFGGESP